MNDEEFELEPLPKARSSSKSRKEEGLFLADHDAQNHKEHPNSVMIPFGRAFISWHSENGVAVLALIILIVLCILSAFTEILATCTPNKTWADNFLKVIGQGIVATAGALVGAGGSIAVQKSTTRRNNRRP